MSKKSDSQKTENKPTKHNSRMKGGTIAAITGGIFVLIAAIITGIATLLAPIVSGKIDESNVAQTKTAQIISSTQIEQTALAKETLITFTPEPSITATNTPTITSSPFPTQISTPPTLLLLDKFSDTSNKGCLPVTPVNEKEWSGNTVISNTLYEYVVQGVRNLASGGVAPVFKFQCLQNLADFYFKVDARLSKPLNSNTSIGVGFRSDNSTGNHYLFEYRNNGDFRALIYKNFSGTYISQAKDWQNSKAINQDNWNTIEVYGIKDKFDIYVNRQFIMEFSDSTYSSGFLGLAVRFVNQGDSGTWEFDNVEIWVP